MDLAERFRRAVTEAYDEQTSCAELVPMVLSQACVRVLPVAGAGISITSDLRVPLGASSEDVVAAERLQSTLGEGPCLTATEMDQPLSADIDAIASQWPMFHRQLVSETPFRSIVSLPLCSGRQRTRLGALDLYLTIPEQVPDFFVDQVALHIAHPIAAVLFEREVCSSTNGAWLPPWFDNASVEQRMHVWVAVGILVEHSRMSNTDALSALRAYAFSHDVSLDDLADDMMGRKLRPEAVFV